MAKPNPHRSNSGYPWGELFGVLFVMAVIIGIYFAINWWAGPGRVNP